MLRKGVEQKDIYLNAKLGHDGVGGCPRNDGPHFWRRSQSQIRIEALESLKAGSPGHKEMPDWRIQGAVGAGCRGCSGTHSADLERDSRRTPIRKFARQRWMAATVSRGQSF